MPSCPLPQLGVETAVKLELWLTVASLESERERNVEFRLTVKGYIDIVLERNASPPVHYLILANTTQNTSARNAQLHNRSRERDKAEFSSKKQLNTKGKEQPRSVPAKLKLSSSN